MKPWSVAFTGIVREVFKETSEASEQIAIASERFRKIPEFALFEEELIQNALQTFVYAERSRFNAELRNGKKKDRAWRQENIPQPKARMGTKAVQDECDWYYLKIGARDLGDLTFGELPAIRDTWATRAETATAYVSFLDMVIGLKQPDNITVSSAGVGKRLDKFAKQSGLDKYETPSAAA